MRFGKTVLGAIAGAVFLASLTVGCGPTQQDKDLTARIEAAASKAELAANKAEAAARSASDAAQRAQAAADKADAIFQKRLKK
jgi:hypothetical protein